MDANHTGLGRWEYQQIGLGGPGGALRGTHLRQLFQEDPKRGERYTLEAEVPSGEWRGHTGKQIRSVVYIGIGGGRITTC